MVLIFILFPLVPFFEFVAGHPQLLPRASSVTIFAIEPVISGVNPTFVDGTEWVQPIGTSSDGSVTTFILENVVTTSDLETVSGSTVLTIATETGSDTIAVSASGYAYSYFTTPTAGGAAQLGGEIRCFVTAAVSGECIEEEVLDDGMTATTTVTGDAITKVLAISTVTTPSITQQSTSSVGSQTPLGPLLGGLLGGLVALATATFAVVFFCRRWSRCSKLPTVDIEPFFALGPSNTTTHTKLSSIPGNSTHSQHHPMPLPPMYRKRA
ncbi:hypothetical protein BDP27DRAFT_1416197 [Rhodocollybia butyracea]|uniref:Transmembrane protein n=1 Tax=Rhodocollybia butyracea TaxID=206335 RepID=A0A9P5Q424_9AGAR|nr:hypothetical protein BDP27DRAFT_1416197 [Rhodocollybia butyracea]